LALSEILMEIVGLDWEETIPIRQKVLWPDKPSSFCKVEGDEAGRHYGVIIEGALVCVASIYIESGSARLRKFATLEDFQNRGIGTALLKHMIEDSQSLHVNTFWFDARESAIEFYRRFGFSTEGERFFKSEIAYFKMAKRLVV